MQSIDSDSDVNVEDLEDEENIRINAASGLPGDRENNTDDESDVTLKFAEEQEWPPPSDITYFRLKNFSTDSDKPCNKDKCFCDEASVECLLQIFCASLKTVAECRNQMCPYTVEQYLGRGLLGIHFAWVEFGTDGGFSFTSSDPSKQRDRNEAFVSKSTESSDDELISTGELVHESPPPRAEGTTWASYTDKPVGHGKPSQIKLPEMPIIPPPQLSDISNAVSLSDISVSSVTDEESAVGAKGPVVDSSNQTRSSETRQHLNSSSGSSSVMAAMWVKKAGLDVIRKEAVNPATDCINAFNSKNDGQQTVITNKHARNKQSTSQKSHVSTNVFSGSPMDVDPENVTNSVVTTAGEVNDANCNADSPTIDELEEGEILENTTALPLDSIPVTTVVENVNTAPSISQATSDKSMPNKSNMNWRQLFKDTTLASESENATTLRNTETPPVQVAATGPASSCNVSSGSIARCPNDINLPSSSLEISNASSTCLVMNEDLANNSTTSSVISNQSKPNSSEASKKTRVIEEAMENTQQARRIHRKEMQKLNDKSESRSKSSARKSMAPEKDLTPVGIRPAKRVRHISLSSETDHPPKKLSVGSTSQAENRNGSQNSSLNSQSVKTLPRLSDNDCVQIKAFASMIAQDTSIAKRKSAEIYPEQEKSSLEVSKSKPLVERAHESPKMISTKALDDTESSSECLQKRLGSSSNSADTTCMMKQPSKKAAKDLSGKEQTDATKKPIPVKRGSFNRPAPASIKRARALAEISHYPAEGDKNSEKHSDQVNNNNIESAIVHNDGEQVTTSNKTRETPDSSFSVDSEAIKLESCHSVKNRGVAPLTIGTETEVASSDSDVQVISEVDSDSSDSPNSEIPLISNRENRGKNKNGLNLSKSSDPSTVESNVDKSGGNMTDARNSHMSSQLEKQAQTTSVSTDEECQGGMSATRNTSGILNKPRSTEVLLGDDVNRNLEDDEIEVIEIITSPSQTVTTSNKGNSSTAIQNASSRRSSRNSEALENPTFASSTKPGIMDQDINITTSLTPPSSLEPVSNKSICIVFNKSKTNPLKGDGVADDSSNSSKSTSLPVAVDEENDWGLQQRVPSPRKAREISRAALTTREPTKPGSTSNSSVIREATIDKRTTEPRKDQPSVYSQKNPSANSTSVPNLPDHCSGHFRRRAETFDPRSAAVKIFPKSVPKLSKPVTDPSKNTTNLQKFPAGTKDVPQKSTRYNNTNNASSTSSNISLIGGEFRYVPKTTTAATTNTLIDDETCWFNLAGRNSEISSKDNNSNSTSNLNEHPPGRNVESRKQSLLSNTTTSTESVTDKPPSYSSTVPANKSSTLVLAAGNAKSSGCHSTSSTPATSLSKGSESRRNADMEKGHSNSSTTFQNAESSNGNTTKGRGTDLSENQKSSTVQAEQPESESSSYYKSRDDEIGEQSDRCNSGNSTPSVSEHMSLVDFDTPFDNTTFQQQDRSSSRGSSDKRSRSSSEDRRRHSSSDRKYDNNHGRGRRSYSPGHSRGMADRGRRPYSLGYSRGMADRGRRPNSSGHLRDMTDRGRPPNSPGHSRATTEREGRSNSPGHSRATAERERRSNSPGHPRATAERERRSDSPGYSRATAERERRSDSPGHSRGMVGRGRHRNNSGDRYRGRGRGGNARGNRGGHHGHAPQQVSNAQGSTPYGDFNNSRRYQQPPQNQNYYDGSSGQGGSRPPRGNRGGPYNSRGNSINTLTSWGRYHSQQIQFQTPVTQPGYSNFNPGFVPRLVIIPRNGQRRPRYVP